VKLLAYRIFDPVKAPLLPRKPLDLAARIATRAYELYKQRGRRDGQAGQDWLEAEREIRKPLSGTGEGCVNVLLSPMSAQRHPPSS
jgi:hypothetical protein